MGQPINVVEKPTSTPGIARFETNRSLTGMGHERYASVDDVLDDRPVDILARRLFETGGVSEVHANGSVVTVHLAEGWTGARLLDVIRSLYIFYPPTSNGEASAEADAEADTPVTGESAPSDAEADTAATVAEHGESAAAGGEPVADVEGPAEPGPETAGSEHSVGDSPEE